MDFEGMTKLELIIEWQPEAQLKPPHWIHDLIDSGHDVKVKWGRNGDLWLTYLTVTVDPVGQRVAATASVGTTAADTDERPRQDTPGVGGVPRPRCPAHPSEEVPCVVCPEYMNRDF